MLCHWSRVLYSRRGQKTKGDVGGIVSDEWGWLNASLGSGGDCEQRKWCLGGSGARDRGLAMVAVVGG